MGCSSSELSFLSVILHEAIFCFWTFCEAVQTRAAFLRVVILFAKRALCVFRSVCIVHFSCGAQPQWVACGIVFHPTFVN